MSESASTPKNVKSRRLRWAGRMGLVAAGLSALWCGLWFYGTSQIDIRLDAWLLGQRQLGSDWTCPQRSITGFPLRIELACAQPTLVAASDATNVGATLKSLLFRAQITSPDRVEIFAASPLVLNMTDRGQRITLAWDSLTLTIHGLVQGVAQADLVVKQPKATLLQPAGTEQTGSAAMFRLHMQPNPQRPASEHALDARLTLDTILAAALDGLSGSQAPADISAAFTLSQADFPHDLTLPQQLERWRQNGGRFDVTTAILSKGPLHLDATGHVILDDMHRVEGGINAQAKGLAPVLASFGVPVAALNVGNLLNGLLKLGKGKPEAALESGTMAMPLKFQAGEVFFGPLKMPVTLKPLY